MKNEREIKSFLLRSLLAAGDDPMRDEDLRSAIRNAFRHPVPTEGELGPLIKECEANGWITGGTDELLGLQWTLTPKGKLRAQQL